VNDINKKVGENFLPANLADTSKLLSPPPPPLKIPPSLPIFHNYSTNSTDSNDEGNNVDKESDPEDNESNELTTSLGNGQSSEHSSSSKSKTYEISIISISSFLVLGVVITLGVLYNRYRRSVPMKREKLPMIEPGSPAIQRNPMATHFVAP